MRERAVIGWQVDGRRRGPGDVSTSTLISLPADMLPRLVIVVVVAAAAAVVSAVPLDDAEPRQTGGGDSNFTISGDELDKIVDEIKDQLGLEGESFPAPTPVSSIGNVLYSAAGFVLGGLMLFVSLFDATRKPVIAFFDQVFGTRQVRRRRDASEGLEARVTAAFQAFTAAVDKMNAVMSLANEYK